MNGQIVLCKGIQRRRRAGAQYFGSVKISAASEKCFGCPGRTFEVPRRTGASGTVYQEDAKEVLATIHKWQKKLYEQWGDFILSMLVMNGICWRESRSRRRKNYDGYIQLEKRSGNAPASGGRGCGRTFETRRGMTVTAM